MGPSLWLRYFKTLYPTRRPADFDAYCAAPVLQLETAGTIGSAAKDDGRFKTGF